MFHFIKTLEREVLIAAILVLAITALTTEGFGGAGRDAMAAVAETTAAGSGGEREDSGKEILARGGKELLEGSEKEETKISPEPETDAPREKPAREAAVRKEDHSLSREDYEVLLKIVEAEAGICDAKGKILVANVVLNRVKSQEFPDSVTAVVYQPSQFSPVSNGSINTCRVSSETVESVNRALKGEDYSQGALFFMNRAAARGGSARWFDGSLTYLFGHQGHEFFK